MNKLRIIFITLSFILLPATAAAQPVNVQNELNCLDWSLGRDPNVNCDLATKPGTITNTSPIFTVLDDIIARLPFYLTIIAFFALLYSGGMYIFALGDATKMETAKKNITWAAIGMLVMATIGITIRIVYSFTQLSQRPNGYIQDANEVEGIK